MFIIYQNIIYYIHSLNITWWPVRVAETKLKLLAIIYLQS